MSDTLTQIGEASPGLQRRALNLGKPWEPGTSGNPLGRPKGYRNKLGEAFLEAMHNDFKEHGISAIVKVREEKPEQYLKVIAMILPKQLHINETAEISGLSTDVMMDMLTVIQGLIGKGGSKTIEGEADNTVDVTPPK